MGEDDKPDGGTGDDPSLVEPYTTNKKPYLYEMIISILDKKVQQENINNKDFWKLRDSIRKIRKIPKKKQIINEPPTGLGLSKDERSGTQDEKPVLYNEHERTEILAPLDTVFLDDALMDDIVTKVGIPELLEGSVVSGYSGVILYGPPGTGKTVLLDAICETWRRTGAYATNVSTSSLNDSLVGSFARNLETVIKRAIDEAINRRIPSFISLDEGSILAMKASEGANSVSKHYQEAIDVLKRYIGNERRIVMGISTNVLPESFEDALTREGRLTTFFIGYPDVTQRARMWKYFVKKYDIIDLTDEQARMLAEETKAEQGAFIDEFCNNYYRAVRASILKAKGYSTLREALKHNVNVSEQEIRSAITYDKLYVDVRDVLKTKYERIATGNGEKERKEIGFRR